MNTQEKSGGNSADGPNSQIARFGAFQFNLKTFALQRNGYDVKLQNQPSMLLGYLIQRSGRMVTRDELRGAIWPSGTYVEFDFGLNTAVSRLRRVLGDSAAKPRYIETVPKQGYRFIAPLEFEFPAARAVEADLQAKGPVAVEDLPDLAEPVPGASPRLQRSNTMRNALLLAIVLVIGGLVATRFWQARNATTINTSVIRYAIPLPTGYRARAVTVSPKGDEIVYVASGPGGSMLYRRYLDAADARPVPASEGAVEPFFSPDGAEIGFFTPDWLRIAGVSGHRDLVAVPRDVRRHGLWGGDGYIYFNTLQKGVPGISRVPARGGPSERVLDSLLTPRGYSYRFGQQLVAGGLLYSVALGPVTRFIEWLNLSDHTTERLIERGMGGQVVPTGHLLYYWNGSLWGVPFHSETHKLTGSPVEVQTGVLGNGWLGGAARVSDNGTLVYLKQEGLPARRLVWVTPGRPDAELLLPPAAYEEAEVSPDGSRVAVVAQEELHRWNIGIYDIKSRGWTRLLDVDTERPRVAWSPDSQALAVGMSVEGGEFPNLFRVPVATPEKVERLGNQPDFGQFPMAWSGPANAILFLEGIHPGAESDVMILPLTGDRHPRLLVATPGPDRGPSFSPDGHWFTYSSDSAGQVFVQDVAQTLPARQISRERGSRNPLWAPSGKQIYFLAPSAALMEVSVDSQAIAGEPRQVIAGNFATLPDMWTRGYSLAPDGRFLVTRDIAPEHPAPSQINVVVNWFVELKRLAPVI